MDLYETLATIHRIVGELEFLSSLDCAGIGNMERIDELYDALKLEYDEIEMLMWSTERQYLCYPEPEIETLTSMQFLVNNLLSVLKCYGSQPSAIKKTLVRCRFINGLTRAYAQPVHIHYPALSCIMGMSLPIDIAKQPLQSKKNFV